MAALPPYTSMFSYSITRPYPFRWFTPTVFVVGILAAVLFSFINLATSGYDMITITTPDPNTTIANVTYFQHWPSFLTSKIRPTCEPQALTVNREYFTNNTALSYRIASIGNYMGTYPSGRQDTPYLNNPLRYCTIPIINYYYEQEEIKGLSWTLFLEAWIACHLDTDTGIKRLWISSTYGDRIGAIKPDFHNSDEENTASFWWGESILYLYRKKAIYDMSHAVRQFTDGDGDFFMKKGVVKFSPLLRITKVEEFKSNISWLTQDPECLVLPLPKSLDETESRLSCSSEKGHPYNFLHNAGLDSDTLAKAFYSTIMADLGQSTLNILSNSDLLEHFTANLSEINDVVRGTNFGLANGPYTAANASRWNLGINPSVLSMTYLCQIPQLKSTGTLIFSVLIANLVLLQALWKVFILCTDFFVIRKHPEMNSCLGCQMNNITTESNIELGEYNRLGQESMTEGPGKMRTESVANEIKIEERDRLVQEQSANKDSREELLQLDESQRL